MSKKPARLWISDTYESSIEESLETLIETAIAYLEQTLKDATEAGFKDLEISEYEEQEDYSSYSGHHLAVIGKRLETDKEYNKRCRKCVQAKKKAKKEKEELKVEERAEYERLKTKFEPSDTKKTEDLRGHNRSTLRVQRQSGEDKPKVPRKG